MSSMPPSGSPEVILPSNAKDPILILVLALFLGGVAYFLFGQWQKGAAAIGALLVAIIITIITCGIGAIIFVPLQIAIVIDAYLQNKALSEGHSLGHWTFFDKHL